MSFTFENYRLDPAARQLFRRRTEVHLSPKAFDLLVTLVERRTRAVSKTELHDRLWPGTFVTESNLTLLVAELRRALGDDPKTPKFIRTVHRFGYAFCAPVAGDAPPPSANRTCWIVWKDGEVRLSEGENIIGRDADASVRLDVPSVSRRHTRITLSPAGVTAEDLDSKNGTFVRSRRIAGVVELKDSDELKVGSIQLTVRILAGAESTQTVVDS